MWKCKACGESNFYISKTEKTNLYNCDFDDDGEFVDCYEEEEEEIEPEIICAECRSKGHRIDEIAELVE